MHKEGLISTKEYEWKMGQLRIDAAEKIMSAVNSIVNSIADLYQTMRDAEFDRLERQKAQELRLYGNNADSRAQIEQKYEKEKLKLQIEYADKDMAIKILQTVSAGALAAVQAVAQLGPYCRSHSCRYNCSNDSPADRYNRSTKECSQIKLFKRVIITCCKLKGILRRRVHIWPQIRPGSSRHCACK